MHMPGVGGSLPCEDLMQAVTPEVVVPSGFRRLCILLVEDNNRTENGVSNHGITASFQRWIASLFRGNCIQIATTEYEDSAVALLTNPETPYDVALIDLDLGPTNQRGGIRVMARAWDSMVDVGTVPIIYSGNAKAREPFKEIAEIGRPFQMVLKGAYEPDIKDGTAHWDDSLRKPLIEALRKRARQHSQEGADPRSVQALHHSSSTPSVIINGTEWSTQSLLAPFLHALPGENSSLTPEAAVRGLFPSNDLIRIFTYWFKAQQKVLCLWPDLSMYGLTTLKNYHCGAPTGPMDALMHDPTVGKPTYGAAGEAARKDLQVLNLLVEKKIVAYFEEYIGTSEKWTTISGNPEAQKARDTLKGRVMFKMGKIRQILSRKALNVEVELRVAEGILNRELYCAPHFTTNKPVVIVAATMIAESLLSVVTGKMRIVIDADGELFGRPDTVGTTLPHLNVAICHQGQPCKPDEEISSWFQAGHSLGQAAKLLKGYATWTVLSKNDPVPRSHEAIFGQNCGNTEELWKRFDPAKTANVIHVLRFGIPLFVA